MMRGQNEQEHENVHMCDEPQNGKIYRAETLAPCPPMLRFSGQKLPLNVESLRTYITWKRQRTDGESETWMPVADLSVFFECLLLLWTFRLDMRQLACCRSAFIVSLTDLFSFDLHHLKLHVGFHTLKEVN